MLVIIIQYLIWKILFYHLLPIIACLIADSYRLAVWSISGNYTSDIETFIIEL